MSGDNLVPLPPHVASPDLLELRVVSCAWLGAYDEVAALGVTEASFSESKCARVWRVLAGMDRRHVPMGKDVGALVNELQLSGVAPSDAVDWAVEVDQGVPTAASATYYAQQLLGVNLRRRMVMAGTKVHQLAVGAGPGDDLGALVAEAELAVWQAGQEQVRDATASASALAEAAITGYRNPVNGDEVMSGFRALDDLTNGFRPGNMVILAARPSQGKTTCALNIALNVAREGHTVGFFSCEMPKEDITTNALASLGRLHAGAIRGRNLSATAERAFLDACEVFSSLPLYIDDTSGPTLSEFRARARRMVQRYGCRLLVVDYLQLIRASSSKSALGRYEEVTEISATVKGVARDLCVPIIALCQLSRKVEDRPDKRPQLGDLRDSGSIEQDADLVLLLHRPEHYLRDKTPQDLKDRAVLQVAKNRNGPTGELRLRYEKPQFRMEDV